DLVRIVLTGALPLGKRIKTDTLASSLRHSFYYVEIKDETHTKISADDFKNDISLKGEFIRSVISDGSLTDKEKNAIINLGLEVLYNDER
ncbi:MAG: DNA repair exonuclease, partial [Clostridia bacterium]|nr:DNA repair exonuclease [Clostridia bacterium]